MMDICWKNDGWQFDSLFPSVFGCRFRPSFVENEPMSGTMLQKSFSQTCQKKVPQQKIAKSFPNAKKCPKWFYIHHYTYIIHICSITINIYIYIYTPIIYHYYIIILYHRIIHHIYIHHILYHHYTTNIVYWRVGFWDISPRSPNSSDLPEAQPKGDWKNSRALTWSGENGRNCYGNG
jgi:hypothetical protein